MKTIKRKGRFLIGFFAAAVTFGSLMTFVGPNWHAHHRRYNRHHNNCTQQNNQSMHNNNVHVL
jgi:hypothetical protein